MEEAYCAVVMADHHKVQRENLRGLYTAVALRKTRLEKEFKIIAELYYDFNEERFRYAEVTKLVPLERVSSSVMVHACMNPGISDLLVRILSFNAPQIALLVGVAEEKNILKAVKGRTFNGATKRLREQNILLLAVYRVLEKDVGHAETELDFRNPSPYFLNPNTQEDSQYRISEKDDLLIIRSNIADTSSEQVWNTELVRNLPEQSETRLYNATNEHLLIIGRGKEIRDVISTVTNFAQSIISISMEENGQAEITVLERSGTRKLIEKLADFSLKDLEAFVHKHKNIFSEVTRAVILEVSPIDSNVEQENVIYQDDAELSYAIVLLDLYRKLFERDLHIAAEMRADVNLHLYHDIGIAQPIPINRLIELILARMVFHGGLISEFFLKTMSYRPDNNKVRLEKQSVITLSEKLNETLVGKTFDEAMEVFFKYPVQLLAFVKADGQIVLNPKSNSDAATAVLENGDSLFIFVKPGKHLVRP